jgi:cysteine desulfurase
MGMSRELATSSIRFSLGRFTKGEDIEYVLDILPGIVSRIREANISRGIKAFKETQEAW